jgi:hypothetical protein
MLASQYAGSAAKLRNSFAAMPRAAAALSTLVAELNNCNNAWQQWATDAPAESVAAEGPRFVAAVRELAASAVPQLDAALAILAAGGMFPAPPSLTAAFGIEVTPEPTPEPVE